ncbi:MAG: hypothetical protein DI527_15020 [Chelatococcus sp.]|nr:MAG: hypothetical protein DI527_15020 [Chelatococcus sp.]
MTTRTTVAALTLAATLSLPLGQAGAQTPPPIRPDSAPVTMDDARRIAAGHGVIRVEEIKLDDGRWEIEGRDALGAEIEIELSARDGSVVKIERERPASAALGQP